MDRKPLSPPLARGLTQTKAGTVGTSLSRKDLGAVP